MLAVVRKAPYVGCRTGEASVDALLERLRTALAGRYAVEREIGSGGMALVYLADDLRNHRKVALKVLRPELALSLGADRFLREIEIAAGLNHPHILRLHDSGEADGLVYYVMPFVEGESLRDRLARESPLPVADALRLLRDVADALVCAHAHGVVHRDIKPDNVMISGSHAVVTDFGIAKAVHVAGTAGPATSAGISLGTPLYMAPEQVRADPGVDRRADLYALGVVAYEMLAGRPPFDAVTADGLIAAQLTERPRPIRELRRDIPARLAALVSRCLEKRPADRFQSADDLVRAIDELITAAAVPPGVRRRWIAAAVSAVALLGAAVGWGAVLVRHGRRVAWVHAEAIPRIAMLADSSRSEEAWALAMRADRMVPGDSLLLPLLKRVAPPFTILTQPAGATVERRALAGPDTLWHELGRTPITDVRLPSGGWDVRVRLAGYRPVETRISTIVRQNSGRPIFFALDTADGGDAGMVRIPAQDLEPGMYMPGLGGVEAVRVNAFRIAEREVTNREYKAFVDAGGYSRPEFWREPFSEHGRTLTRRQAMARFVDRTGRPGPATWEAGEYPQGEAEYPVGGLSWYEAAAYARFAGKSLPTLYHWVAAAAPGFPTYILRYSNYSGRPAPVGAYPARGLFGTLDMAGNAREWCSTESEDRRYIMGGGWNDHDYDYTHPISQSPFDRSPSNGVRLVRYAAKDTSIARLGRPVVLHYPDYTRLRPVADNIFAAYRRLYDYDPAPLNARVIARDSLNPDFVHETIAMDAAYGGERLIVHVMLPRRARRPLQPVVYWPGSGALNVRVFSFDLFVNSWRFVVTTGRAVVYPVYRGTYERGDGYTNGTPNPSAAYRDHFIMWIKDFRRAVEYVTTRPDFDSTRIAFFGTSWGGYMGAVVGAVEPRLRVQVLSVAGLPYVRPLPEVDPLNFISRVRIPTLLIGSENDPYFPLETSQKPFMRLLGTRDTMHVVSPSAHNPGPELLKGATLAWLDRFLGPVSR